MSAIAERRAWRALLATVAACALLPAASAAAAPHLVVWSGGLTPGQAAVGVELRADGSGQRLSADAKGKLDVKGKFAPRGKRLVAIQAAAEQVLAHAPTVTHAANVEDGSYVTVVVQDGARRRFVADTNADSSQVRTLLKRLDATLPHGSRVTPALVTVAGAAAGPRARAAVGRSPSPATADCPEVGKHATEVTKFVSLEDAVRDGIVTNLQSKGVAGGDAIAVDAESGDVEAPASITIHAEISTNIPGADLNAITKSVQDAANQNSPTQYVIDGQPVNMHYDFRARAEGSAPSSCNHQILVTDDKNANGSAARAAVIGYGGGTDRAMVIPRESLYALSHEIGHLMDLPDPYTDEFVPSSGGASIPLPQNGLEGDALQAALPDGVNASEGQVVASIDPDIEPSNQMGFPGRGGEYTEDDLRGILERANIHIHADPGTIVIDKLLGDQNFAVGAPFDMDVPNDGSAHADGIVAYCIDLLNHDTPAPGVNHFDVLPTAGRIGGEAMSALQRVLDVVAARQPGPLEETPGANLAIWRVTDDAPVAADGDPATVSILAAAGIPLDPADKTFAASHFADPAAGIPHPVAFASPASAMPLAPAPRPKLPRLALAHGSKLAGLRVGPRRLRAPRGHRAAVVVAQVTLAGAPDRVALTLTQGHHGRTVTVVRTRSRRIARGLTPLVLFKRRLKPGHYLLVASGAHSGSRHASVTVTRARKR